MLKKIKGKYVVGFDGKDHEIIVDGEVVYQGSDIVYVGKHYEGQVDETEDVGNAVIMPGFIDLNALGDIDHDIIHLEAYQDVRNSIRPSEEYYEHMHELMTPEEEAFKSLFAYAQLIMNGVTTAMPITSTYYKKWAETYEEQEAAAHHAGNLGLRIYLSPSYQSGFDVVRADGSMAVRFKEEEGEKGLLRAVEFCKKFDGAYDGLIRACLEPERIECQTEKNLLETKKYSKELGCPIKLHAAQGMFEYQYIKEKTGRSPIQYLYDLGFLEGGNVGIPHCYYCRGTKWVEDKGDDLALLAETGTTAIHCPIIIGRSGHYLNSFAEYRRRNINIAVGTDTFPPDFFQNIRTASMYSRMQEDRAEGSTYADIYRAVTLGGAKMLGRDDLGRLCKGAKADMIVVGLDDFHMGAIDDPVRTIFMCGSGHDVKMSIINGRTVMKDRKIEGVDLEALKEQAQRYYDKMKMGYQERDGFHIPTEKLFRTSYPMK